MFIYHLLKSTHAKYRNDSITIANLNIKTIIVLLYWNLAWSYRNVLAFQNYGITSSILSLHPLDRWSLSLLCWARISNRRSIIFKSYNFLYAGGLSLLLFLHFLLISDSQLFNRKQNHLKVILTSCLGYFTDPNPACR